MSLETTIALQLVLLDKSRGNSLLASEYEGLAEAAVRLINRLIIPASEFNTKVLEPLGLNLYANRASNLLEMGRLTHEKVSCIHKPLGWTTEDLDIIEAITGYRPPQDPVVKFDAIAAKLRQAVSEKNTVQAEMYLDILSNIVKEL